jgi:23S rRNA G2445 N2-methylase RlmL|tara:strand:- start:2640 stop:3707 length:1068 start_codon:yes stop_codon:yes gene_type:complete
LASKGKSKKQHQIALLTVAGLAETTLKALHGANGPTGRVLKLPNHDLILLSRCDEETLRQTSLIEDSFMLLGKPLTIRANKDLVALDRIVSEREITAAIDLRKRLFPGRTVKRVSFNTYLKQDTDRKVYRKQIVARVNQLVQQRFRKWRLQDPALLELWGFFIDEKLYLGVRLTDERVRYNFHRPVLRKGALRPTVAAAMAYLISPSRGELIVDPMCGTATLIQECVALQPEGRYICGDRSPAAVRLSQDRLGTTASDVICWDALSLPLRRTSVDGFICNMPFGRQYGAGEAIDRLYLDLLKHWLTLLTPAGRMLIMVADGVLSERALRDVRCRFHCVAKVKLLGMWTRLYRIEN